VDSAEISRVKRRLVTLRKILKHGGALSITRMEDLTNELGPCKSLLRPRDNDELLCIVDRKGKATGIKAPRWLCHLLDLRHACVHVLLTWRNRHATRFLVLQVRSWRKADSPGCVDISVGGHVVGPGGSNRVDSAYREMTEEMGITRCHLVEGRLTHVCAYQSSEKNGRANFFNTEWREIYTAEIKQNSLGAIDFADNEVVGFYLCPEQDAQHLLRQTTLCIAGGLRFSLPHYLDHRAQGF
jgi:isopentenyldiphosphate isomerase